MAKRARIRDLVAGIPRFLLLLARLIRDPRVSGADKGLLAAAVAYTLTPIDLIPDFLPIIGQLDDLFFLALAIDRLITRAGAELVLAHWDGPEDVLVDLCGSLEDLARRLPAPVRNRLAEEVEAR
ncbi:MAG: DUF1232 domain-containing protein [Gemmatimonadota bacterium]|nr:MAG: DUF1232 domain-containing protein [Gemmatimonadota bacterium]